MSKYYLSEAYSDIYNTKDVDQIDDNLRFIDYMLDEDIEEVVESLVWEFRDYGNSLQESFNLLSYSASDEVITESYEQLIESILNEANPYAPAGSKEARAYQKYTTTNKRRAEADQQSKQRKEARRARVDGAISRVKSAMAGAKGGMGRAAKALGGAATSMAKKGKAMLGRLLRKGASATGKGVYSAGKAIESRGKAASQSGLSSRQAGRSTRSGQMELVLTPSTKEKTGGTASQVGRAVRKVGVALQRMGKGSKSAPEAKSTSQPKALPAARPETESRRAIVQRRQSTAAAGTTGTSVRTGQPARQLALPAKTSGEPIAQRKQEAAARLQKATAGTTARGTRFAGPRGQISPTRTNTGYRERLASFAKKLNEEDYETLINYILEDIITEGYATDENIALDILESLSENSILEIASEYLID